MDPLMQLRQAWDGVMSALGADAGLSAAAFRVVAAAYGAPDRHYHGLAHIAELLDLAEAHSDLVHDKCAIDLAILFHDVVYDPRRSDNEEASARVAEAWLPRVGADAELCAKVARYVRATAHSTKKNPRVEPDLAFLLDIDLSILAADPVRYRAYAEAIRREYAHVTDDRYRQGRAQVLRQFLMRERIYVTPPLQALWEAGARTNLAAELAVLDNGVGSATGG